MLSFQIKASHLHIGPKWLCQPEIGYTTPHFSPKQHTHYQIEFALFNYNGGTTCKTKWIQHNIYILSASTLASAVSADWLIAPSLQNVRVDTQYVGINEEQKHQIRQLHEELALVNCVWYRTLPAIATRVRNVLRSSNKMSTTPIDHINQQAVATNVREAVLPGNKCFQRVGVGGGMIKKVCVRWY